MLLDNPFAAFLAGAFVMFVFWGVYMGAVVRQKMDEIRELKEANKRLSDELTHERRGYVVPEWEHQKGMNLVEDGKRRKPKVYDPDFYSQFSESSGSDVEMIDLTRVDDPFLDSRGLRDVEPE